MLRLSFWIVIWITSCVQNYSAYAQSKPALPTILVPGILGSKLCAADGEIVWGTAASLKNLERLELSSPQQQRFKPCGIVEDIQVFGPFYSIKAYTALREAMTGDFGFVLNKTLFIFDYDWRLSNFENARKLQNFVQAKLGTTQKFNILTHSMGGIVARIYIENTKQTPRVHKILYMGTPFLGSMSTFGTLSEGWGWIENSMVGGKETIRRVALSWPGMLELLPRYQKCCSLKAQDGSYTTFDPFDAIVWKRRNWLPAMLQTGANFESFERNLEKARSLSILLQSALTDVIEVKFAGDARDTRFVFTALLAGDGTSPPTAENWRFSLAPGDGTVPEWSAARNPQLQSLEGSLQSFSEHATIFDDKWVRSELKRELTTQPADTHPPISGSGHPQLRPVIDGEVRSWQLLSLDLSIRAPYVETGSNLEATVTMTFDAPVVGLRANAYVPIVQIRQGNLLHPLALADLTIQGDIDNRQLRYIAKGSTVGFSEGAGELVISFPDASPPTAASEYFVLLNSN
jgi:hypothetical protein